MCSGSVYLPLPFALETGGLELGILLEVKRSWVVGQFILLEKEGEYLQEASAFWVEKVL